MNYDEITGRSEKMSLNLDNLNYKKNSANQMSYIDSMDTNERFTKAKLFKIATIIVFILGFIFGIICGVSIPMISSDSLYSLPEETFNWVLMLTIWVATAISSLSFWAVYCHLSNQEEAIAELKHINDNIVKNK